MKAHRLDFGIYNDTVSIDEVMEHGTKHENNLS
jgi:hypothetical protein